MGTGTAVKPGDLITAEKINSKLEKVDTGDITDDAVTTPKIADGAVTTSKIADDAVTLAKLENGTQGDILYYGAGGAPARLAAGTSGQVLKTQGAGANPIWAFGEWHVVSEVTTTSNVTYVDFTGLDINTDKVYVLFITIKNPLTIEIPYYIFFEGDYTTTNYYTQYLITSGSSFGCVRSNNPQICNLQGGAIISIFTFIMRDSNGFPRWHSDTTRNTGSSVEEATYAGTKTAPVTNITSIRISSSQTEGIGTGAHFLLCKPK